MRAFKTFLVSSLVGVMLLPATVALAYDASYNYNYIITDDELLDTNSMSQDIIQQFLAGHGSRLATAVFTVNGAPQSAAQVIYSAAQANGISPKVLLVTLQKEQSLIDDSGYTTDASYLHAQDRAMGYNCPDSSPCDPAFFGFVMQVNQGAAAFRRYLNNLSKSGSTGYGIYPSKWGPGIPSQVPCYDYEVADGFCPSTKTATTVTPANFVTSALYTYTPHFHGNYNFWKIWKRWGFDMQRLYPDGTLLKAKGGVSIYLIQNGQKRRFNNMAAFFSRYSPSKIITVPADHLLQYQTGKEIAFANYSLLASPQGGVYLLVNDTKRPIKNRAAFQNAGFSRDEVVKVKWSDLNQFPDGEAITSDNIYPAGQLVQNKKTGAIFFVQDGVKHPVYSKFVYKDQYGLQKPTRVTPAKLDTYTLGSPIGFRDGDLIQAKGDPAIYVISNGYRLPIANPGTFNAYQFKFANVLKVDNTALWIHPLGPKLDASAGLVQAAGH